MESTSAPVVHNIPISAHDLTKMIDNFLSSEWLAFLAIALIAVIGFYVVLILSKNEGGDENVKEEEAEEQGDDDKPVNGTPQRRTRRAAPEQLGTINTPDGRRSRRLANKRKEE